MPHRRKKKKKDEDHLQICPLCSEQLDQLLRCNRCETRVIASEGEPDAQRVLLSGKLTAVDQEELDLEVGDDRVVRVKRGEDFKILHAPGIESDQAVGTEAAALGELSATFCEHHGGLRDAAERSDWLRASDMALGSGARERLLKDLERRRTDRVPDMELPHVPSGMKIRERERGDGQWELKISRGRGLLVGLLLVLWMLLGAGYLGGLIIWQLWKTAGPSLLSYSAAVIVGAVAFFGAWGILWGSRRTVIVLNAEKLRARHMPLPNPVPRGFSVPVSELSHTITRDYSLRVVLFGGEEHDLLPWTGEEDRTFIGQILGNRLGVHWRPLEAPAAKDEQPSEEPADPSAAVKAWRKVRPLLYRVRYAAFLLCFLPFTCMFTPYCTLIEIRPVWLEAVRKANSCSKVTDRLGQNVTWAFGKVFTRDMERGEATLAVKGDLARGEMEIKFRVPVSDGVYLRRVNITVGEETVCAVCCAVYGQDPRHGGPRQR